MKQVEFLVRVDRRSTAILAGAMVALLTWTAAGAQTLPDAGSMQKQLEDAQRTPLPARSEPGFLPPSPMESIGGETITVSSFRFAGNALLGEGELSTAVAPFVGRPLDFAGLQNAALAVANA